MYAFIFCVYCFLLGIMFFFFKKKNQVKVQVQKRVFILQQVVVFCDHVMNLEKNYEEKPNVEVVDQSSTIEEITGMPLLIESTTCKWIM
jgi:hypothetical protein